MDMARCCTNPSERRLTIRRADLPRASFCSLTAHSSDRGSKPTRRPGADGTAGGLLRGGGEDDSGETGRSLVVDFFRKPNIVCHAAGTARPMFCSHIVTRNAAVWRYTPTKCSCPQNLALASVLIVIITNLGTHALNNHLSPGSRPSHAAYISAAASFWSALSGVAVRGGGCATCCGACGGRLYVIKYRQAARKQQQHSRPARKRRPTATKASNRSESDASSPRSERAPPPSGRGGGGGIGGGGGCGEGGGGEGEGGGGGDGGGVGGCVRILCTCCITCACHAGSCGGFGGGGDGDGGGWSAWRITAAVGAPEPHGNEALLLLLLLLLLPPPCSLRSAATSRSSLRRRIFVAACAVSTRASTSLSIRAIATALKSKRLPTISQPATRMHPIGLYAKPGSRTPASRDCCEGSCASSSKRWYCGGFQSILFFGPSRAVIAFECAVLCL